MPALAPVIRTIRSVWSGMSKVVHRAGTAALLASNTDSPLPLRGTADHGCSTARVDDMAATGPDCCAAASQPVPSAGAGCLMGSAVCHHDPRHGLKKAASDLELSVAEGVHGGQQLAVERPEVLRP